MNRTSGLTAALFAVALASSVGVSSAEATVDRPPITITPSPLVFNAPRETAKTVAVVITHTSGAPVTFGSTSVAGTDAGDVAKIKNPTTNGYTADGSPMGSINVTGGACVDYIFPTSSCTILVSGSPGTLEVFIGGLKPFILTF